MVRIVSVPLRYLQESKQFHAFQWVEAKVAKHESDPRPESIRLDFDTIKLGEFVRDHAVRRAIIENSPHFFKSVEELKERNSIDQTSLGIVVPESILDCTIENRSATEHREWKAKERLMMDQSKMFEHMMPIDFIDKKFYVQWRCKDERYTGHKMGLHQWGIHQLYRKYKGRPDMEEKVIGAMQAKLDQWEKDVFLFLGNFRDVMYNFGLMDSYSAPAKVQNSLFT